MVPIGVGDGAKLGVGDCAKLGVGDGAKLGVGDRAKLLSWAWASCQVGRGLHQWLADVQPICGAVAMHWCACSAQWASWPAIILQYACFGTMQF
jgi:hypothetical protein